MADIQPFRGLRYNQTLNKDLPSVICPPYDIIPPALHEELLRRNDYNFIRIEDASSTPYDTPNDSKYTRAAATLQRWLQDGILVAENKPAIYVHKHYFHHQGREYCRQGIIARVRLEEWETKVVRPHEGILGAARDDRLNLLWALQINTSPVLSMYEDDQGYVSALLKKSGSHKPVIDAAMADGERHIIYAITAPEVLNKIAAYFAGKPLYIADGHHRYTSALTYRREKMRCTPGASSESAFNFVMMTLVSFSDPGLIILAPHRLLSGIPHSLLDGIEKRFEEFFKVTRLPLSKAGVWDEIDRLVAGQDATSFACMLAGSDHVLVLTRLELSSVEQTMPYFHSELYRKLDVSVIDHIILERIFGMGVGGTDEAKITYSYDRQDAVARMKKQEFQIAFFLKPVKPELIETVADAGDKMPRKSTYFYPKAPAGLVENQLTD